jgi:hypothetical protein
MSDRNGASSNRKAAAREVMLRAGGVSALLIAMVALSGSASLDGSSAGPQGREFGFIVTEFAPAISQGKDDCPDGLAGTVRENYLGTLPAAERTRLLLPQSEVELTQRWKAYAVGPNNTNVCANPELFDHGIQYTVQSNSGRGLNLDGRDNGASSDGCDHADFTSPDGTKGIDNQVFRAMGCTRNYRGIDGKAGDLIGGLNHLLATGEHSMVVLVRGVDNLVNDPSVEVVFASTEDRPILDSKGGFVRDASFTVSANPAWRTVLHGRIKDGVLTTDPADVRLNQAWGHGGPAGARAEWDFRRSMLQLRFLDDGTVRGYFGGYMPVRKVIQSTILGGLGAATIAGVDCAAQLRTLQKMADGMRDPKTGQCTAISTAMDIAGVPAFVNDRGPKIVLAARSVP